MHSVLSVYPAIRHHLTNFQKVPLSPIQAKRCWAWAVVLGCQFGLRRSPYHSLARIQPWRRLRVPPRARSHCLHQRSTCCSDRNRSMVFQVKTMSLYQSRAGTAIWIIPLGSSRRPFCTWSVIAKLQQPQAAPIWAFFASIAGMPSASQMQLAE
jgi:hypothetical protein